MGPLLNDIWVSGVKFHPILPGSLTASLALRKDGWKTTYFPIGFR